MEMERSLSTEESSSSSGLSETVPGGFHVTYEAQVVFWIVFGLLIGYVEKLVSTYTRIPYSPMLLITGVFLSYFDGSLSLIGHVTELVLEINPHGILQIFIPTLIFESGLNMNFSTSSRRTYYRSSSWPSPASSSPLFSMPSSSTTSSTTRTTYPSRAP